jgi:N-acetyl-anhydromuramyl-L-alanine amidase AmpD
MKTLQDIEKLHKLSGTKFWKQINDLFDTCMGTFTEQYKRVETSILSQEDSADCLFSMYVITHKRINAYNKKLAVYFPTPQCSGKLNDLNGLWWLDHYTCGINQWNTLTWFSGQKGATGKLHGASTHFVIGHHDIPFLIIPPTLRAWHEPSRNADSIGVEMVNPGALHQVTDPKTHKVSWHYWAGILPQVLVAELPPTAITPPYRGCSFLQPFTLDQYIHNMKVKRLIIGALPGKLTLNRMSQHSDWRLSKPDMGPLWPLEDLNNAAWDGAPLEEQHFLQRYNDSLEDPQPYEDTFHDEISSPEYGMNTPTQDSDPDDEFKMTLSEVQASLNRLGSSLKLDGLFGDKTKAAVMEFQNKWNSTHPDDMLKIDGIPGPHTCASLKKALN